MKQMFLMAIALVVLTIVPTCPCHAQVVGTVEFTTNFPFYVQNTKLPAGSYEIHQDDESTPSTLDIRSKDGAHALFVDVIPTSKDDPHQHTDVTFHDYGGVDFLDHIWVEGDTAGVKVAQTPREKRIAAASEPTEHSVTGSGRHES